VRAPPIVVNTSALSNIIIADCFETIRKLFEAIIIPEAVREELALAFRLPQGLQVRTLTDTQRRRAAGIGVGKGEDQAIMLAQQLDSPLIIDDGAAKNLAKRLGIQVIGSVEVLIIAFQECLLDRPEYEGKLQRLYNAGRINYSIYSYGFGATQESGG